MNSLVKAFKNYPKASAIYAGLLAFVVLQIHKYIFGKDLGNLASWISLIVTNAILAYLILRPDRDIKRRKASDELIKKPD